jgi:Cdc6-like AAA superfamily ATPase
MHDHLSPSVVPLLSEPDDIRIEHIQKGAWLGLEDAMAALKRMDAMLHHPTVPRMPNLLLVGPSFSGKTSILHKFVSNHLPNQAPEREATVCPVVMVEAPPKPDISDFYSRILDAMFAHVRHTASPHQKYFQIKQLFRELSVKMLIIDEIHHLVAGSMARQREFRNAIKSLGNETQVSIVAAGIDDAYNAMNLDPQMASRFPPLALTSRWEGMKAQRLLRSIERQLPLAEASWLCDEDMTSRLTAMAEGSLGNICDLCKTAAIEAIKSGKRQITRKQIDALDWIPPSARRKHRPIL